MVGASEQGSTACVCFIIKDASENTLHVANLGDTRGILITNTEAIRLTVDHKASDPNEVARIQKEGGFVEKNRVAGSLAVSRALGDLALKKKGVSNIPSYRKVSVVEGMKYLIMASDGLWDVVDDNGVFQLVKNQTSAEAISKLLVQNAIKNGSKDNVSVLVLKLN